MYTLFVALGVAFFVALFPLVFGISPAWTVLPGIIAGVAAFIWMSRRIGARLKVVTEAADAEMAQLQQAVQRPGPGAETAIAHRFDRSIEILKRGFVLEKWQFGSSLMLNARIGMLVFTRSLILPKANLAESIPYLEKVRLKGKRAQLFQGMWPAWAMLAAAYYRSRKDVDGAAAVLEDAVTAAKKESLLWNLYAWILWKEDRLDAAIAVLARGKHFLPDDERLNDNLTALQNRKGMKMKAYGEQWYQFGLERPKMAAMQPQMSHPRTKNTGLRRR